MCNYMVFLGNNKFQMAAAATTLAKKNHTSFLPMQKKCCKNRLCLYVEKAI